MDHASGSGSMLSSGDMSQKTSRPVVHRRRSSKGLIALESRGASSSASSGGDTTVRGAEETNASNNTTSGSVQQTRRPSNEPASVDNKSSVTTLPNPCCSARLALSCVQNAVQMGVMTKVFLCPQGRARKSLLTQARLTKKANLTVDEDRFLNNNPSASLDVAEEDGFSSGDDDDYDRTIEEDGGGGCGVG